MQYTSQFTAVGSPFLWLSGKLKLLGNPWLEVYKISYLLCETVNISKKLLLAFPRYLLNIKADQLSETLEVASEFKQLLAREKFIIFNGLECLIYHTTLVLTSDLLAMLWLLFYVHGSVHRDSMSIIVQQVATIYSLLYFFKLLYMFRVVTPPIIRSIYNCITASGTCQISENAVCEVSATFRDRGR